MTVIPLCQLSKVKELFDLKEYPAALIEVKNIDLKHLKRLDPDKIADYYYTYARCLYRVGDYAKSLLKARVALVLSRDSRDHAMYATQKQLLGHTYVALGRLDDAVEAYLECYAFRKRAGDLKRIYASLLNLALTHFQKGGLHHALELLESSLKYASKHNSPVELAVCRLAIARVMVLVGRYNDADRNLSEIDSSARNAANLAELGNVKGMIACFQLDYPQAFVHLSDSLRVNVKLESKRYQAVCLEYLGLNEYFQGNYRKAKEYYQQVLAMPEPTASAVAQTLRMLTDVYVAEGDFTTAMDTAVKAEVAITKINERIEMGALYRAYGQIYEHLDDQVKARKYFNKSIDLLHQLGARYELALSYSACSRSACYSHEVRLEHLAQCKSLFVDMDVPKRVAQVEQVIADLNKASVKAPSKRNHKNSGESSIVDPEILTEDPEMKRILADAFKLANTDLRVLITGETGTGKDLLAERIHCLSGRKAGPFRNENMSRLPSELAESELFGCEKGSHSGALAESIGLIESADGGTFCLNEIAELPLDLQAKLLQVIEHRKLRRVGGTDLRAIDVRFIAMTNADLDGRVAAGLFRPDLRQRLTQEQLHLPPLRERKGDLPLLTQFFLRKLGFGDYDLDQAALIMKHCGGDRYVWPGNVRELQSVLEAAVTLTGKGTLTEFLGRLKLKMQRPSNGHSADSERAKLTEALKRNGGNQSKAARELMMSPSSFRRRLQRHSII